MAFENIPEELRAYRQWCVWNKEETLNGKPTKVPYAPNGKPAKVNDPSTWCSYEEAVAHAGNWSGIGFILSDNDPFGFIDLDKPKHPNGEPLSEAEFAERMEKQRLIYTEFDSYSELSPSGEGLHIIVKGKVESGRRRDSVEVYSNLRFMTMTGQVFNPAPIADRSDLLQDLWAQMGKGRSAAMFYAGLENAAHTDEEILQYASSAKNGEKFIDLYYRGDWQRYYPSQSEADFAVIDILAFFSKNRRQVQQLFLRSKLAEREKSRASYRIDYMLNRCFDNLLPPVDFEGLRNQVNAALEERQKANAIAEEVKRNSVIAIDENKAYLNLPPPQEFPTDGVPIYNPPEGLLGEIAQFIYAQSPLPVPEIALAGAIGLMSGICGKAYNISNTGLNQYTLLLAATGTGKESAAKGISKLVKAALKSVPAANEFIGPSEIASPQALLKYLANQSPCFLSVVGEFGLYLKQLGAENASPNMQGLKRTLLDLFNKSGHDDVVNGIIYSDRDKDTGSITAPAFSLFGESVPERFYEALHENMISEGFLPRFTIIEYKGDRVAYNDGAAGVKPTDELVQKLSILMANALNLQNQKIVVNVTFAPDADIVLRKFRDYADSQIKGSMELKRQLWNRAHIKVLKLAALVAVGKHPYQPEISVADANWAIKIVEADIKNIHGRFETGHVGSNNDENKQVQLVVKLINKYVTSEWASVEKIVGPKLKAAFDARIVPYSYLQRNTSTAAAFKSDKMGATNALKRTLKILQDRGDVQQMSRAELVKQFGTGAECYAITCMSTFGI
jgi:hypothetical protein